MANSHGQSKGQTCLVIYSDFYSLWSRRPSCYPMKVNLRPSEPNLVYPVQVCQGAVGAARNRRHNIRWMPQIQDHGSLASDGFDRDRRAPHEEPAMGLVCSRFEMDF